MLAVGADEEKRMVDRRAGRLQVESEQVVVTLELEAPKLALALRRASDVGDQPVLGAPLGPADEEDARVRQADASRRRGSS